MPARMTVGRVPAVQALAAALFLAGCSTPKSHDYKELARREAFAIVAQYEAATNAEDAARLAALYAPDAFLLPADGGVVHGQDQIHQFWSEGLERGLVMDTLRTALNGELGWIVGRYYLTGSEDAPPDSGKFVLALTRNEGHWQVAADIWNATPSEAEEGEGSDPRTRILTALPGASLSPAVLPAAF